MKPDKPLLAIGAILIGLTIEPITGMILQPLAPGFPFWQYLVLRSTLVIPICLALAAFRFSGMRILPHSLLWAILRSLLLFASPVLVLGSAQLMPLPSLLMVSAAMLFLVLLLAPVLTRDRFSGLTALAIALGLVGSALIISPTELRINSWSARVAVGTLCYAIAIVLTREKCRDEHPLTLVLVLNAVFVMGGLTLFAWPALNAWAMPVQWSRWAPMDAMAWLRLSLDAVAFLVSGAAVAYAYQRAPVAMTGVFEYGKFGIFLVISVAAFGLRPIVGEWLGLILVFVAMCLAFWAARRNDRMQGDGV